MDSLTKITLLHEKAEELGLKAEDYKLSVSTDKRNHVKLEIINNSEAASKLIRYNCLEIQ